MIQLIVALLVIAGYVVGLGVVGPLGLAPDLLLLVVVAVALSNGPEFGALTGFCAGLLLDLAPGATTPVGSVAVSFTIIGYVVGRFDPAHLPYRTTGPSRLGGPLRLVALVSGCLLLETVVHAGVNVLIGAETDWAGRLSSAWPTAALAPIVVPVVMFLLSLPGRH